MDLDEDDKRKSKAYNMDMYMSKGREYNKIWYMLNNRGVPVYQPQRFVLYFIEKYHITRLNGKIVGYFDNEYISDDIVFDGLITFEDAGLDENERKSIMKRIAGYLAIRNISEEEAPARYIRFKDKVYDVETDSYLDPYQVGPIMAIIPWDYDKTAYNKEIDSVLDKITCYDSGLRNLLEEMIGYCMYRSLRFRKMFVLTGGKRNGKSTFLDLLIYSLGDRNTSKLELHDFNDIHHRPKLFRSLANIGDDIDNEYIKNISVIKRAISGEYIDARDLYESVYYFRSTCTPIFSANDMPTANDVTGALADRVIYIPFNAYFSVANSDLKLADRIMCKSGAEYILRLGMDGLKRILQKESFSETKITLFANEEMVRDNDHFSNWISEYDTLWKQRDEIFNDYLSYCSHNNIRNKSYSKGGLVKRVNVTLGTWAHKYSSEDCRIEPRYTQGMSRELIERNRHINWTGRATGRSDEYCNTPPLILLTITGEVITYGDVISMYCNQTEKTYTKGDTIDIKKLDIPISFSLMIQILVDSQSITEYKGEYKHNLN